MKVTLGICLLVLALAAADNKDGFNLFKDYLRTGKDLEGVLPSQLSPKFLYFYRAAPSLLAPEVTGGAKRNQFWRSVGRRELDDQPLDSPGALIDMESFRPIAARTILAKRDVTGSEDLRSKKAVFSWNVEPRRVAEQRYPFHSSQKTTPLAANFGSLLVKAVGP